MRMRDVGGESPQQLLGSKKSLVRSASALLIASTMFWPLHSGVAAQAPALREYAIAAGALDDVLARFAAESGVQLVFETSTLDGLRSEGLQGEYEVQQGFDRLLRGSGYRAVPSVEGSYSLEKLPEGVTVMSAVKVQADANAESANGPAHGYVARRSSSGTKTDAPLLETPQAISVVTREQMEAQNAQSLEQLFGYSAGISPLNGGAGNVGTSFTVRGFNVTGAAPLYLNGSKFPINSLSGSEEPFLYERVELVKGPASVLYGQAPPGGVINLVSKRPTETPLRDLELQVGSWDRRQLNADFGGPINQSGTLGYRVTGLVRDSGTMVDHLDNDRETVSGSLSWNPSEQTSLLLLANYTNNRSAYDYGKPYDGTALSNPNGKISRDLFVGEPGFDDHDTKGYYTGYQLSHSLGTHWQLRQNLLVFDRQTDSHTVGVNRLTNTSDNRTVGRSAYVREDGDDGWSIDNQVQLNLAQGRFEHTLLAGLDYSHREFDRLHTNGTVAALDVFEPVYGSPVTLAAAGTRSISENRQLGLYAQEHIKFDQHWVALLGARWDDTEAEGRTTAVNGTVTPSQHKQEAMTYRAGLIYLFDNGLAPYLSWTQSFQPQSGFDFAGNAFDPTMGDQYEAGLKFEPQGIDASLTVAVYELTREKVLSADPDHANFSVQIGEVRSRGVEVEGRANLIRNVDVIAAYGYTDAEITQSNNGDQGRVPTSTPRYTASLWLDYQWQGSLNGLSTSAGVRNVGKSFSPDNSFTVSSYTVYDAALRYLFGRWRFALNVKNLLDENYVSACTFACFYGDERNVTVSARYSW